MLKMFFYVKKGMENLLSSNFLSSYEALGQS